MTIEQLQKELQQNQLATIYLVLGQESALIEKARQLFKHYLPEEERTMNFASYDLATTDVANALDDAESAPFLVSGELSLCKIPIF